MSGYDNYLIVSNIQAMKFIIPYWKRVRDYPYIYTFVLEGLEKHGPLIF